MLEIKHFSSQLVLHNINKGKFICQLLCETSIKEFRLLRIALFPQRKL